MNHLLAQLKGQPGEVWKVMSQEQAFHDIPNVSNVQKYSSDYKLDDDVRFPKNIGQFNLSGYNPSKEYNHGKV